MKKQPNNPLISAATTDLHWWDSLPEDYDKTPFVTEIHQRFALKIKTAAAMDSVVRSGLAAAVLGGMAPNLLSRSRFRQDLHQLAFYSSYADRADVAEVFQAPPKSVAVKPLPPHRMGFKPKTANCQLLGFNSGFEPLNPALRDHYASLHHNRRAVAQHWRHPDGPRPTLILTHGFGVDSYRFNNLMFSLQWFYRQGYDILLNTMPFHGYRAKPSDVYSGLGFFSHGLAHMNEAFLQSVQDLRVWIDYLAEQGAPAIGVSGYSLGGYVSALAASIDDRLAFAIPNSPGVLLPDMVMGWPMLGPVMRHVFKREHIGLREFRHMTALHCPLNWQPVLNPERLLIIGGAGDRFTSPRLVNKLHEHWQGSRMHWFPGNHLVHLQQARYLHLMKDFMDRACANTSDENAQASVT